LVVGLQSELAYNFSYMPQLVEKRLAKPVAEGRRLLVFATAGVLLSAALALASYTFVGKGWLPPEAAGTGVGATRDFLALKQGTDSWMPMLRAARVYETGQPIYESIFFKERVKFQYPLTSLLPLIALRKAGVSEEAFLSIVRFGSWLAVWATIGVSIAIFFAARRAAQNVDSPDAAGEWVATLALVIAGLNFYPLLKGFALGQIQTFLTLFFALACYCWVRGQQRMAGALIGFMILVKPHYAVLGLWFVVRRRFGALWAALTVVGAALAVATAVFGWSEQIKYLDVIREASRGYAYYPNLSFNGLINRLLFNGSNLIFDPIQFPPYHPVVNAVTVLASIAFIGAALFYPRTREQRGGVADFCAVSVAVTAASPMAWEHHYAILFPVFAVLMAVRHAPRSAIGMLVAYLLVASAWTPFNIFAAVPVFNVLQSVFLAGVLTTLVLLWKRQTVET